MASSFMEHCVCDFKFEFIKWIKVKINSNFNPEHRPRWRNILGEHAHERWIPFALHDSLAEFWRCWWMTSSYYYFPMPFRIRIGLFNRQHCSVKQKYLYDESWMREASVKNMKHDPLATPWSMPVSTHIHCGHTVHLPSLKQWPARVEKRNRTKEIGVRKKCCGHVTNQQFRNHSKVKIENCRPTDVHTHTIFIPF